MMRGYVGRHRGASSRRNRGLAALASLALAVGLTAPALVQAHWSTNSDVALEAGAGNLALGVTGLPDDLEVSCTPHVFARHGLSFVRIWDPAEEPGPLTKKKPGAVKIEKGGVQIAPGDYSVEPLDPGGLPPAIGVPLVVHVGEIDLTITEWYSPPDEPGKYYGFEYSISPAGASLVVDVKTGGKQSLSRHVLTGEGVWPPIGTYLPDEGRPGALCESVDGQFAVANDGTIPVSVFLAFSTAVPSDLDPPLCPQIEFGLDGPDGSIFSGDLCSLETALIELDEQSDPGDSDAYSFSMASIGVLFTDGWIDRYEFGVKFQFGALQWNSPGSPFDESTWGWRSFFEHDLAVAVQVEPLPAEASTVTAERVAETSADDGAESTGESPVDEIDPVDPSMEDDVAQDGSQTPGTDPPPDEQPPVEPPAEDDVAEGDPPPSDGSSDPTTPDPPPADEPPPEDPPAEPPPAQDPPVEDPPVDTTPDDPPLDPGPPADEPPPATTQALTGVAWVDRDHDGVYVPSTKSNPHADGPAAGVVVRLLDSAGGVVAETVTDDGGFYEFVDLLVGDYSVEFVGPEGFEFLVADPDQQLDPPIDKLPTDPDEPFLFVADVIEVETGPVSLLGWTDSFRLEDGSEKISIDAALITIHPARGLGPSVAPGRSSTSATGSQSWPAEPDELPSPPGEGVPGEATVPEEQGIDPEEAAP